MADTGHNVLGYEILAMREACRKMEPYKRSDCPFCGYPLRVAVDGITGCIFCGWRDQNPLRRDIPKV